MHIIADQGRKGVYFFVFEVVLGQTDKRDRGKLPSSYEVLLAALHSEAPMYNITECFSPPAPLAPPLQLQDVLALEPEPDCPQESRGLPPSCPAQPPQSQNRMDQAWPSVLVHAACLVYQGEAHFHFLKVDSATALL